MKLLLIIFVGLTILFAGCVEENPTEAKFKNDVVTIENYFVSNVAPYEKGETSIQFEIHNNGYQTIPYLEVDFFDVPGFTVTNLECQVFGEDKNFYRITKNHFLDTLFVEANKLRPYIDRNYFDNIASDTNFVDQEKLDTLLPDVVTTDMINVILKTRFLDIFESERTKLLEELYSKLQPIPKCTFRGIETLDVRSISLQLNSIEEISSPTPHTVGFAVRYTYFGSRDVGIPVIDGETRKQPLTKLRQSDPSVGPVALDIDPSIEREIIVADKTIKEHWAIGGRNPLPFLTKLKFEHIGSLSEKVKDVNITLTSLRLSLNGLNKEGTCDFCNITTQDCRDNLKVSNLGQSLYDNRKLFYKVSPTADLFQLEKTPANYSLYSTKSASVPFDTLVCTFRPTSNQPEYSASISAFFAYKYEFIKSQDFVVQPLPE